MQKKYYKDASGYSTIEIPIRKQEKLIRKMKAYIRRNRRVNPDSSAFYFCAYGDIFLEKDGREVELIMCADLVHMIELEPERSGSIYIELPFTRKRDFKSAKEMFLGYIADVMLMKTK